MLEGWTTKDLYSVLPAIGYLVYRLKCLLKDARVVFIINTELKEEITEAIKHACDHFGVEYLQLSDIHKRSGHPDTLGMIQIKNQVIEYLKNN